MPNNIKVQVTFGRLLDKGLWDKYCEVTGLNPYCINEGRASIEEIATLTEDEAIKIGLIKWESTRS